MLPSPWHNHCDACTSKHKPLARHPLVRQALNTMLPLLWPHLARLPEHCCCALRLGPHLQRLLQADGAVEQLGNVAMPLRA